MAVICRLPQGVGDNGKMYLYNEGTENVLFSELNWKSGYGYQRATNTKKATSLYTEIIASSNYGSTVFAGWQTTALSDISKYNKLHVEIKTNGAETNAYLGFTSIDLTQNEVSGSTIAGLQVSNSSEYQILEMNISEITTECYLYVRLYTSSASGNGTFEIKKVWLEK